MTGTGGTITLNNLNSLQTLGSTTLTFAGNATYNLNGFTSTTKAVSCAGTNAACVYNINILNLTNSATSNRLLFDGLGTLNVGSNVIVGNFTITNATNSRTLNFGTNWIYIQSSGVISCNLLTTTVTTTNSKNYSSLAGGIRTYNGNTGTLTVTNQNEDTALNLLLNHAATLGGTLSWRNIVGSGGITNSSGTLTVFGDYIISGGAFSGVQVNFSGTDSNISQTINTSVYGPNVSVMSGASPKIISGDTFIKTLTTQAISLTISNSTKLYCDSIAVQGTSFTVNGDLYTNNWNTSDATTYYWNGNGYLRIGESQTTNPAAYGFVGNTTWNSARVFDSTSSRGAGTGPNLYQRGTSEGYYSYASASINNPHRVKNIALYGTSYSDTNLIFKVKEGIYNYNTTNANFNNLTLIVDNQASNFTIYSSYNMSSTNNSLPIWQSIDASSATIIINSESSPVHVNSLEFVNTITTTVQTNSVNLTTAKIICGTFIPGNSIVTLNGNTGTIFDTVVSTASNHEIIITGTGNKDFYVRNNNLNIITNNSPFTHTGNGDGTGWLDLLHSGTPIINTVRTGNGLFSKGTKCSSI